MTKQKNKDSGSQDSCHHWRQLPLFELPKMPDSMSKMNSNESESLMTQSAKSEKSGHSTSLRRGARPVAIGRREYVALSKKGFPIGESAARAKYTDKEIDMVFQLREEGLPYRQIAKIMDIPRSTCFAICHGLMRAQLVYRWKRRS